MKRYKGYIVRVEEVFVDADDYREAQQKLILEHGWEVLDKNHRDEVIVDEVEK
jgi:hypothetical protein